MAKTAGKQGAKTGAKKASVKAPPKGKDAPDKNAEKRGVGRPAIIETPEQLQAAIAAYFETCKPEPVMVKLDGKQVVATDAKGRPMFRENPPTVAGLAYDLGYQDRQSIYDLRDRGELFSCHIKRALLKIEAYHEANLSTRDKPTGDIFWLKNYGWTDKQEIDHHVIEPPKLELVLQGAGAAKP